MHSLPAGQAITAKARRTSHAMFRAVILVIKEFPVGQFKPQDSKYSSWWLIEFC